MYNIWTITKREFRSYFGSPVAYIFLVVFLLVSNWLYFQNFFLIGEASLRALFFYLPIIFIIIVPAITMRLWAEERKLGTIEILFTLPLNDSEAVIGKFIASFLFLTLNILLTLSIPITLSAIGNPDAGPMIGGYVGVLLIGGAYISIGLFASSITDNQIVAFIIGVVACFFIYIVGDAFIVMRAPGVLAQLFQFLGLAAHFQNIERGVIDSRDIIYYLSVIIFFISLTVAYIQQRR
ncbi:MAG TPA: ABC transporter permease [bacterium]|nr:ABC transporter permease [bacterium]